MSIQLPTVAGQFYPKDPAELRNLLEQLLSQSEFDTSPFPKAIIAPHAGYVYSGLIAGNAYRVLSRMPHIKHVILIGPSHYTPIHGAAVPSALFFQTPLGDIPVNQTFIAQLLALPKVEVVDKAFSGEHCLEVQLPFLQMQLTDFTITPILVGQADKQLVADILEQACGREDTLFVISSDLSHYHNYEIAVKCDQQTTNHILRLHADAIHSEQACGCVPIKGLVHFAHYHHLEPRLLDKRNSGDTQGDKSRVVGYSAFHFYEPESVAAGLQASDEQILLDLAKHSIQFGLTHHHEEHFSYKELPEILHHRCATFVTINIGEHLRGCIGSLEAVRPIAEDVVHNAYASAFQDPRFQPLSESEFAEISIEISLLSPLTLLKFKNEADLLAQLNLGIDGVILEDNAHRGVFLPVVWEKLPDKTQFWQALKQKARMAPDYWSDSIRVWIFTTRVIK